MIKKILAATAIAVAAVLGFGSLSPASAAITYVSDDMTGSSVCTLSDTSVVQTTFIRQSSLIDNASPGVDVYKVNATSYTPSISIPDVKINKIRVETWVDGALHTAKDVTISPTTTDVMWKVLSGVNDLPKISVNYGATDVKVKYRTYLVNGLSCGGQVDASWVGP